MLSKYRYTAFGPAPWGAPTDPLPWADRLWLMWADVRLWWADRYDR